MLTKGSLEGTPVLRPLIERQLCAQMRSRRNECVRESMRARVPGEQKSRNRVFLCVFLHLWKRIGTPSRRLADDGLGPGLIGTDTRAFATSALRGRREALASRICCVCVWERPRHGACVFESRVLHLGIDGCTFTRTRGLRCFLEATHCKTTFVAGSAFSRSRLNFVAGAALSQGQGDRFGGRRSRFRGRRRLGQAQISLQPLQFRKVKCG